MIKPFALKKGDKVAIVCLSDGILGKKFYKHQLEIALKRFEEFGLIPIVMPNALKNEDYLKEHPEVRAEDLKAAFMDKEIKCVICAIGGNDTYKLFPYLMEDDEFKDAVKNNPKIFTGFSDSTMNHFMFYRLGLQTFYGPCLLPDIAELDKDMLPYTKEYFLKFFKFEKEIEIKSSDVWYEDRKSYSKEEIGKPRITHKEEHGYEVLNGSGVVTGKLYGGCIESIYDSMTSFNFNDELEVCERYNILLSEDEWKDKVLFLESSELKTHPKELEKKLSFFKEKGIFSLVKGVIIGKPMDEKYYEEYKPVYKKIFSDLKTPVLYNLNFGHSVPRIVLPYGAKVEVDYDNKKVVIKESFVRDNN